ncbi:uncharacterized protein LOC110890794 isoform X1 [Helianthus annuus]|uniref:uncharacterized protein LOC110890794 isoform X1 n=1 Tax=Helianthus annuus TaxID=4232 RepID=UPI001653195C|nr:uncharacterized protein LOC110890794 isoform X1 [Helianthus annuus]
MLYLSQLKKKAGGTLALVKQGQDKIKSTPAGEYLTSALNDFDLEHYDGLAAISDGTNKLLMLVLAAVIKAGASREHEILAELLTFNLTFSIPTCYISPLAWAKSAEKMGPGLHEYRNTYDKNYCLGQLIFWHNQAYAEPNANLIKASRGCLSLPEIGSFYSKIQKPSSQRVYGLRTVKSMLSRMVMEQLVDRLDVAMFNAILRESAEEMPTNPLSDPIGDLRVLRIPAGKSSFGAGAQLKNTVRDRLSRNLFNALHLIWKMDT